MYADDDLMRDIQSLKFDLFIVEGMPFVPWNYMLPHIFKVPHVT